MNVAAIIGESGAGKSTLIVALIRSFVADGIRVAAIKHTHHPLNEENRGDTAAFLRAGARPVVLAREGEAVLFDATGTRRIAYTSPADLAAPLDADVLLVEGFKSTGDWPRIELSREHRLTAAEARAILDRIWAPGP